MVKIVPWLNGSGNITLSYDGQGDGPILIESDPNNLDVARSQALHVNAGNLSVEFTVNQQAGEGPQPTDYIDLNLPSGLLWAKGNIAKDKLGHYYIANPEDSGCYFSWGNIDGHNEGDSYSFDVSTYNNSPGRALSNNITINDAQHDAAFAIFGSPWHLPSTDDLQELFDNTDKEWTKINNRKGWKFMKKTDHNVFIFIPAVGDMSGTSVSYMNVRVYCWTSSYSSSDYAYAMRGISNDIIYNTQYRRYGFQIRPVRSSLI